MSDPSTQLSEAAANAPASLNYLITAATVLGSTIAGAVAGTLKYGDRIKDAEKKVDEYGARLVAMEAKADSMRDELAEAKAESKAAGERLSAFGHAPAIPEAELRRLADGIIEGKVAGFRVELQVAKEEIARLRDDAGAREREGSEKWEALNRVLGRLENASKTLLGGT